MTKNQQFLTNTAPRHQTWILQNRLRHNLQLRPHQVPTIMNMNVQNVAKDTALPVISPDIVRPTEARLIKKLDDVLIVIRSTSACLLFLCTSGLTIKDVNANIAGSASQDLGCCRDIFERILVRKSLFLLQHTQLKKRVCY